MTDNRYVAFQKFCGNVTELTNFKQNPYIRMMVETVSHDYGLKYYDNIKQYAEYNEINWLNVIKLNNIGNPLTDAYMLNDKNIQLSSTTLRYLQFAFDMLLHIKQKGYKNVTIYEVGGGYGFQAVLLVDLAKIFDIKIDKYTIIDLPEINNIQNLYLQESSVSLNYNFNNIISAENPKKFNNLNIKENSYFISNYAFGELQKQWQDFYIQKLIKKCSHGYICWNFSVGNQQIHEYFDTIEKEIEEENPQTNCPPSKSYIVKF